MEQLELDTTLAITELPDSVRERIEQRVAESVLFAWEPSQAATEGEHTQFDTCPTCGVLASTVAVQLTYYSQEPYTVHMWCLKGHAWRWNEFEGRIVQASTGKK